MNIMSKIGLYGGTFDPVHYGHLLTIEQVKEFLQLDEIRVIPCNQPNNGKINISNNSHREQMLRLALPENVINDSQKTTLFS